MTERERMEIRIGGQGGQGVVMAGAILGEAASACGIQAAVSSTYGSQARGGVTKADVVITRGGFIDFPHVTRPDVLAVLSREAYAAYLPAVAGDGVVLHDGAHVRPEAGDPRIHHEVGVTRIALETLGKVQAANVVLIGVLCAYTGMLDLDATRDVIRVTFPAHFREANDRAFDLGVLAGLEIAGRGR